MHCVTCHLTFGTPTACNQHQPKASRQFVPTCVDPESVGLVGVVNEWGTIVFRAVKNANAL
jgi:hypothetical protein